MLAVAIGAIELSILSIYVGCCPSGSSDLLILLRLFPLYLSF
jgi:hypothetical protein